MNSVCDQIIQVWNIKSLHHSFKDIRKFETVTKTQFHFILKKVFKGSANYNAFQVAFSEKIRTAEGIILFSYFFLMRIFYKIKD